MNQRFLEEIHHRPMVADGAMGSQLYNRGVPRFLPLETLNLSEPALIRQIHTEYLLAGSEVITTNTFGANRLRLQDHPAAHQIYRLNLAGAKLARAAREEVGEAAFVGGSMGPLGVRVAPFGRLSIDQAEAVFREQAEGLLAGGVDLWILETFSDPQELAAAILAVRSLSDLPIVASFTFSAEGKTRFGQDVEDAVRQLLALAVPDILGVNCGVGPYAVRSTVHRMVETMNACGLALPLSAMPNAGLPQLVGDQVLYPASAAYMAEEAMRLVSDGVHLVGGCCGTGPAYIQALATQLQRETNRSVANTSDPPSLSAVDPAFRQDGTNGSEKRTSEQVRNRESTLLEALAQRRALSVEIDPPRGTATGKMLRDVRALAQAGVHFINVADSPMAQVRMSSLAAATLLQQEVGIETILHFTTRDRNLMGLQADLIGADALGLRNLLALSGDPPALGNYAHATAVYDLDSVGLIKLVQKLNHSEDAVGNHLVRPTHFVVGAGANPTVEDLDREVDRVRSKLEAGAQFLMTQPVYDAQRFLTFLQQLNAPTIPILLGILPLASYQHAVYLHNEVPGIYVPDTVQEKLRQAGEKGRMVGIELAIQLYEALTPYVSGVYLMPSFGRFDETVELARALLARMSTAPQA
ncbi:MAG: bifunctional homocysteine S-methyltransferase/methylenetetrahydrofolate reductase [Firmicutes bacterium]|nr:bifunctional homocysteine S-methyltransferase/methylenetetrahydrofolate reductase [Bacillota bacterium]